MKILKVREARLGKTPISKRVESVRIGEDVLVPDWVSTRCLTVSLESESRVEEQKCLCLRWTKVIRVRIHSGECKQ